MENHDYKTAPVDLATGDVIDTSKTGVSDYDDYLTERGSEYLRKKKGTFGKIVQMSPQEYYEACSEYVFDTPAEDLKQSRASDEEQIEYLKSILLEQGKKFPLPYINKAEGWQEGLHRMLVIGELFGWDHKVPVLIIDFVDGEEGRKNYEKQIHDEDVSAEIRQAVNDSLRYKFTDIKEFKDELFYQFDDDEFDVTTDNNYIYVTRDGVTEKFDIDRLQLVEKEPDDLDNLSDDFLLDDELDLFLEEVEESMKKDLKVREDVYTSPFGAGFGRWVENTLTRGNNKYHYWIKVYDTPSKWGIDNGRVSKLFIRRGDKIVANYDRGWDVKPVDDETQEVVDMLLNQFPMPGANAQDSDGVKKEVSESIKNITATSGVRKSFNDISSDDAKRLYESFRK